MIGQYFLELIVTLFFENNCSWGRGRGSSFGVLNKNRGVVQTRQNSLKQHLNLTGTHLLYKNIFFICQAEFVLMYVVLC